MHPGGLQIVPNQRHPGGEGDVTEQLGPGPTALRVNGIARYLRGALYQSYYPDGVYTATSVEVLKNDIASAKKFGTSLPYPHLTTFFYCLIAAAARSTNGR